MHMRVTGLLMLLIRKGVALTYSRKPHTAAAAALCDKEPEYSLG